jgi:hypothetical protein
MTAMKLRGVCKTFGAASLMLLALATTPACIESGRLYVRVAPPAPVVEARVVSPGPGFVWVPGYQRWDGGAYIWVPGRWARPPRPRARWVPGHWVQNRRSGWYFVEGRWR